MHDVVDLRSDTLTQPTPAMREMSMPSFSKTASWPIIADCTATTFVLQEAAGRGGRGAAPPAR